MALPKQKPITPTSVGTTIVRLISTVNGLARDSRFEADIQVMDADGAGMTALTVNLSAHLSPAQINQLQTILDAVVAKAIAEVL